MLFYYPTDSGSPYQAVAPDRKAGDCMGGLAEGMVRKQGCDHCAVYLQVRASDESLQPVLPATQNQCYCETSDFLRIRAGRRFRLLLTGSHLRKTGKAVSFFGVRLAFFLIVRIHNHEKFHKMTTQTLYALMPF